MNKKPQQFNLSRLIKRAILVTLVLALIEVVIIYFIMSNEKKDAGISNVEQKQAQKQQAVIEDPRKRTPNVATAETPIATIEVPKPVPVEAAAPVIITDSVAKVVVPEKKKEEAKKVEVKKTPPPSLEKVVEITLGQQEFGDILDKVNAAKGSKDTKCIQIRKSKNSNVKNAFDVGNYLKTKGYVISGREITSTSSTGLSVDAKGACIKLTIGKM
ncbi:MAG: hypothetical protein JWQ96_2404 [Segetibacter sp.]|nr:hypothetical protein [Segetibacter sp.]